MILEKFRKGSSVDSL